MQEKIQALQCARDIGDVREGEMKLFKIRSFFRKMFHETYRKSMHNITWRGKFEGH